MINAIDLATKINRNFAADNTPELIAVAMENSRIIIKRAGQDDLISVDAGYYSYEEPEFSVYRFAWNKRINGFDKMGREMTYLQTKTRDGELAPLEDVIADIARNLL